MKKIANWFRLCCSVLALASGTAGATVHTVTFNSPQFFGDGVSVPAGEGIFTERFRFEAFGGALSAMAIDDQSGISGDGSPRLFALNETIIGMRRPEGRVFDLLSLDYGGSWTDPDKRERWADGIEITGVLSNGRVVQQTVSLLGLDPGLHSLTLQGFSDLDAVFFRGLGQDGASANNREFVIDNLVVNVPEPQTYAMFLAGLGLLAWRCRTRR